MTHWWEWAVGAAAYLFVGLYLGGAIRVLHPDRGWPGVAVTVFAWPLLAVFGLGVRAAEKRSQGVKR